MSDHDGSSPMSHHLLNRIRSIVVFVFATMLVASGAAAQAVDAPAHIEIPRVSRPPVLADFVAMEAPEPALGMRGRGLRAAVPERRRTGQRTYGGVHRVRRVISVRRLSVFRPRTR